MRKVCAFSCEKEIDAVSLGKTIFILYG